MTWTIDLAEATASHPSGLRVRFAPVPDDPGAFDGTPDDPIPPGIPWQTLPRLMREAGDAFIAARAANQESKP